MSLSRFITKEILKISQAIGPRDRERRVFIEPYDLLEVGCSGNHGELSSSSSSRPVWRHDCNLGQHSTSREVSDDSARQDSCFFKWYGKGMGFFEEAKSGEKTVEPSEVKVAETPEKKEDGINSK